MNTLVEFFAKTWNYLSAAWRHVTGNWKPLVEKPVPAEEVDLQLRQASIPNWGFFFMLLLSSAIATFGLLSNSAPAIIGAMIIAPLMAPILGLAYGIVVSEWKQVSRAALTVITGTLVVVAGAVLVSQRYGDWKKATAGLLMVSVISIFLMEPLGESLHRLSVKSRTMRLIATLPAVRPDLFTSRGRIDSLHVTYRNDLLHVDIDGVIPRSELDVMQEGIDVLRQYLSESLNEPLVIELEAIPLDSFQFISAPDGYQRKTGGE